MDIQLCGCLFFIVSLWLNLFTYEEVHNPIANHGTIAIGLQA